MTYIYIMYICRYLNNVYLYIFKELHILKTQENITMSLLKQNKVKQNKSIPTELI